MTRKTLVASVAVALTAAPAAYGHVEVTPEKAEAGSDAALVFRVPNERKVPTVKLEVKLPQGLDEVTVQSKPGWKAAVRGSVVTWSGGKIPPEQFDEFAVSAHLPSSPGKVLVFPALQTYSNGEVVHWIGAPNADDPAPRVTLEAAESETTATTTTVKAASDENDDDHDGLALGFGIAGLAVGLLALGVALLRRRSA